MSTSKINYRQCSLSAHFNQQQPIKVAAGFFKNMQDGFYTTSRHEDYDLERAVKILHIIHKEKRRYK